MKNLNIIFFFFEDNFFKWPIRDKIESLVETNSGVTVIGITYPISLLTLFSNPKRFIGFLFNPKKKIKEGIYSFTPFSFLPVTLINKSRALIEIHKWFLRPQINNFLGQIQVSENRVTWVYYLVAFPLFFDLVKDSKLLVYQCADEYTMEENRVLKDMKEMENNLLSKADIVFAVSKNIYAARKERNKNCYLIPNGTDFNFFSKAASYDTPLNEELKDIPRPIVGYLGNFRSWLDFELLEFLVDSLPVASFVFSGQIEDDVRKNADSLKRRPNVYFLSRKDREALPGILKGFDVCLIPFKFNQFNLATNPLKFWEYLATGKPILSLRIPDFEPYGDTIALYTTKEEALDKLRLLLKEKNNLLQERRMELAKNNDLSLRSKQYYEILINHLNAKRESL